MKKVIFVLAMFLGSSVAFSQAKVTKDANGNYVVLKSAKKESSDKKTGKTFTNAKGDTFDVWESEKGKLYVIRTSKESGKEYRQYLKVD